MVRARRHLRAHLGPLACGLLCAAALAGCGAGAASHPAATQDPATGYTSPPRATARLVRFTAPAGWSIRLPSSLSREHSTSGPAPTSFSETTVANFRQRRAVVTGRTPDGGFIRVNPPLDPTGRFPAGGVAFRILSVDGPPNLGTEADSRFPVTLSTFARSAPAQFPARDYARLGVPHELTRPIDADGQHYTAIVLIGPAASARARAAIAAVIASLTVPPLHRGERTGDETVLGPARDYPVGSVTLIHALGQVCRGAAHCAPGQQPFYLVHAPGRLHQPDLIQACRPTAAACTPPGAFYALSAADEDIEGGYRSACKIRLDRADDQFFCTNSAARWDRAGRVIRRPRGASMPDALQFAFAKIAWDGRVVFLPGLGGNPPRAAAYAELWPHAP